MREPEHCVGGDFGEACWWQILYPGCIPSQLGAVLTLNGEDYLPHAVYYRPEHGSVLIDALTD